MKRKIALPIFLLAAVLCAVWSFIEAKQPTPASLREQLISALDSADAVYFEPDSLESNQPEAPSPMRSMWRRYAPCSGG